MKKIPVLLLTAALATTFAVPASAALGTVTFNYGTAVIDGNKDACYGEPQLFVDTNSPVIAASATTSALSEDIRCEAYFSYDDTNVYFYAIVTGDDKIVSNGTGDKASWCEDCVELWVTNYEGGNFKLHLDPDCKFGHVAEGSIDGGMGHGSQWWAPYEITELPYAAHRIDDHSYSVEVAFPIMSWRSEYVTDQQVSVQLNDFKDENVGLDLVGATEWVAYGYQASSAGGQPGYDIVWGEPTEAPAADETSEGGKVETTGETDANGNAETKKADDNNNPTNNNGKTPKTADVGVIAAGLALASSAAVIFKKKH